MPGYAVETVQPTVLPTTTTKHTLSTPKADAGTVTAAGRFEFLVTAKQRFGGESFEICVPAADRADAERQISEQGLLLQRVVLIRGAAVDPPPQPNRTSTFLLLLSFCVGLVGFILGALFVSKDDELEKAAGRAYLIAATVSAVGGIVLALVIVLV